MSAKKRLVYNGRHGLPEGTRCFWCGSGDANPEFILNPGGSPLLACCNQVEYEKAKAFINKDNKVRTPYYLVLFVLLVVDLFFIGMDIHTWWSYAPLLGICLTVLVWPAVFTHYEFYVRLGLVKTRRVIRFIACAVALLSMLAALSVL